MKPFAKLNKKLLLFITLLAALTLTTFYFVSVYAFFPNNIKFINGTNFKLNLGAPIEVTITPETVTALNVNDRQVTENITVTLNDSLTLSSPESGTAMMTLNAFGMPVKKVMINILPDVDVVACGMAVGIRIDTEGVMVLGTGSVTNETGQSVNPSEGILKSGDLILSANNQKLTNKEQLMDIVKNSNSDIEFTVKRENEIINAKVTPVKSKEKNESTIGVWIRDSTQGIGTVTYYNPSSGKFAALGHGVQDVDTKKLLSVGSGRLMQSQINSVKRGSRGTPGELLGDINSTSILGYVKRNSAYGIYGTLDVAGIVHMPKEKVQVGLKDAVHEGPAKIRACVSGTEILEYDVYIESVNKNSMDDSRGMVVRITDPNLLSKTSGIVQGMSGSPIIQDGKLIGAVTHVFVQDPTKGYGIFIENMLNEERMVN